VQFRADLQRSELISAALAFVVVALWHWYATDWSEKNPRVNQQELQIITPDRKKHRPFAGGSPRGCTHALFFDVMALKADQHCSMLLLPQCGQRTSPPLWSTRDRILEKTFLQLWQKNS